VSSMTAGKFATGIAGMTGTGSLGITAAVLTRIASAQAVPTGIWAVLAWLSMTTVAVVGLSLVLDYKRAKLEIEACAGVVRSRVDLESARLAVYRGLVERSVEAAGTAASYRALVLADALHLAVEQNDVRLRRSDTRSAIPSAKRGTSGPQRSP
jgi:hypothetical protein